MRRFAVLAVCTLLLSATVAGAEFYRYVDEDGKEVFTNDLKQVPPQYRGSATVVRPAEGRVSVGNEAAETGKPSRSSVKAGEHKDKYGRGEEYWHRKAENLRLKLRDEQDEHEAVIRQLDEQEHPKKIGKKKRTSLEKKKTKLEKDIAKTRRQLEVDLPEEARRADAYPGWIRE